MSYHLPATKGGRSLYGGEKYSWFANAINVLDETDGDRLLPIGTAFKKAYGYTVIMWSSSDGEFTRRFVEFPSEEEAVMFVLKWS